jgi:hypothetical protein
MPNENWISIYSKAISENLALITTVNMLKLRKKQKTKEANTMEDKIYEVKTTITNALNTVQYKYHSRDSN